MLLDLSAAFDTVDHRELLLTLQGLGFIGMALKWFHSYLSGRTQVIKVKDKTSVASCLECGVPQGSVLGPILFTIYTSSLGTILRHKHMDYHLYADDSQLYLNFKLKDIDNAISHMGSCVSSVQSWMSNHHLKMNDDKTEFLIIFSKQQDCKVQVNPLHIGSHSIMPSRTAKAWVL